MYVSVLLLLKLFAVLSVGQDVLPLQGELTNQVESPEDELAGTDLILAFVICRHGDRTPDQEESDLFPRPELNNDNFFPYGPKALTNAGKVRSFKVGEFLRRRYNGFLSHLYLPEEISVRCTDYDRTKMTALAAMAALYPPERLQQWNPNLDWQPVPYSVLPYEEDDLLYWYNCGRYLRARDEIYELPEVRERLVPRAPLLAELSRRTQRNITTPEDVFYLDNLFQAEKNVGIATPPWAQDIMPQIKEMTKLEFEFELYTDELIRLASGVLLEEILNATETAVYGAGAASPRLRLYSAHENNVAALMAAARVFKPHQPAYGATFALELRRMRATGQYAVAAVYSATAGAKGRVLHVAGCGPSALCDYDTFRALTSPYVWSKGQFRAQCDVR